MAKGRATKWAVATLAEPVSLGRRGISIDVWDKWGRRRRGTLVVSVGGVRWYPYKAKRAKKLDWEKFSALVSERASPN